MIPVAAQLSLDPLVAWLGANTASLGRVALIVVSALVAARLLGGLVKRSLEATALAPSAPLARRAVQWTVLGLAAASVARELGFDLSVLLGAAGVLSVAVGFASQTSASNIISGLFLLAERPFVPGDVIRLGTTTGEVLSIDLLSVKLRTFDNLYVRLPNETVMRSEITNLTRFPIRRFDVPVRIAWEDDAEAVQALLLAVAASEPLVLDEPGPKVIFLGWGEAGIELQLSVWAAGEQYGEMRTRFALAVQRELASRGIHLGVPQRRLVQPKPTEAEDKRP